MRRGRRVLTVKAVQMINGHTCRRLVGWLQWHLLIEAAIENGQDSGNPCTKAEP